MLLERLKYMSPSCHEVAVGRRTISTNITAWFSDVFPLGFDVDGEVAPDVTCDWSVPSLRSYLGRPDVLISSLQFNLSDLLAPLMIETCREAAFIHVAGDYLNDMPEYREQWWKEVQEKYYVRVITNLPRVPGRPVRRCQWLCIFKKKHFFKKYWQDHRPKVPEWGAKGQRRRR